MTGCSFLVILNLLIFLVKISIQGIWNAIAKEEFSISSGGENDKDTKIKSSPIRTPYELPKDYQHHPESGLGISTTSTTFQDELKKYDNSKPKNSYDIVTPSKQNFKSQNCLSDMASVDLDLKNVAVQSDLASRDSNAGGGDDENIFIDGLNKNVEDSNNTDDDFLEELAHYESLTKSHANHGF